MTPLTVRVPKEERLAREGDTLGDLLERLREYAFPLLIAEPAWNRVVARARDLPRAMAASPFGFEVPLHDPVQRADLGVAVTGGTQTAAFFKERASGEDADPASVGITRLLERAAREEAIGRVVGARVVLEYGIDGDPQGQEASLPGLFLYPLGEALSGDRGAGGLAGVGVVVDALYTAAGWAPDKTEARMVQQVYGALPPEQQITSIGAFPARGRGIRLGLFGIQRTRALTAFLERVGWPGYIPLVETVAAQLEQHQAFGNLTVHVDVDRQGIGPRLGLSCSGGRPWRAATRMPTNLIEVLRAGGYAVTEKVEALAQTRLGTETLLMKSGSYTLVRGISHVKLTLGRERVEEVKAYVFALLLEVGA